MSNAPSVVLVVDDNEMNRDMLLRRLGRQGYEVVLAEDGKQALNFLEERTFNLVLLDIMMPNINGYEVLETMRNRGMLKHTPVIMISAVDDLDSVVKCIEMGAEDYLFKPFNPVLLKARVEATLEKHRSQPTSIDAPQARRLITEMQAKTAALLRGEQGVLNVPQAEQITLIQTAATQLMALL